MKDEHCFESRVAAVLLNTGKCIELGIAMIVDTEHPLVLSHSLCLALLTMCSNETGTNTESRASQIKLVTPSI